MYLVDKITENLVTDKSIFEECPKCGRIRNPFALTTNGSERYLLHFKCVEAVGGCSFSWSTPVVLKDRPLDRSAMKGITVACLVLIHGAILRR